MVVLTQQSFDTFKAAIHSGLEAGFKVLYRASSTAGDKAAAEAVVRKWFGEACAASLHRIEAKDEITRLCGNKAQGKVVWTIDPRAKAKSPSPLVKAAEAAEAAKAKKAIDGKAEVVAPGWDDARLYLQSVRDSGRRFIAAQICLGWELSNLKKQLGFLGSGRRPESAQSEHFHTWEELVTRELKIPRSTADRFIQVFQGFQTKLSNKLLHGIQVASDNEPKRIGTKEAENLMQVLCTPPASLTQKERAAIAKAIETASDGATQASLLAELKLIKPVEIAGSKGPTKEEEDEDPPEDVKAEQLSFAFFHPALEIGQLRNAPDFERRLNTLPLVTDDPEKPCLVRMKEDLQALLSEVEATIAAKTRH
jgi:hypothetical protein